MNIKSFGTKAYFFIVLVFHITPHVKAQHELTGFIIKSLEVMNGNRFDFFITANIDTTKNIEDNLIQIKNDTLIRITLDKDFGNTYSISNASIKMDIIPVKVIWNDWSIVDLYLNKVAFINFPIKLGANRIINGYNPQLIRSFKKIQVLKLRHGQYLRN